MEGGFRSCDVGERALRERFPGLGGRFSRAERPRIYKAKELMHLKPWGALELSGLWSRGCDCELEFAPKSWDSWIVQRAWCT